MARLNRFKRDSLSSEQRALFDLIVGSEKPGQRPRFPRVGQDNALEGPFNARLLSPAIGLAMHELSTAVRYRSTISDRTREVVILLVANAWESDYERYAHEDIGRAVGLSEGEIATIAAGEIPPLEGEELAAARVAFSLLHQQDLSDDAYASAVDGLGEQKLFEIIALVGLYAQTALQLRIFRVDAPTG